MADLHVPATIQRFGQTARRDAWWVSPLVVFIVLSAFVIYATWAALQGVNYHYGPYLSPLYSPELFGRSPHAWFGPLPESWPAFLPTSPALFILWAPGLFRLTCYYYRGQYYRAFAADPPSCAVGEPSRRYSGERRFPLLLQNFHRYFLYIALIFLVILLYDVWKAMWFIDPETGRERFGVGVGTLMLAVNVVLLGGYTFGCHSLRHLAGGIRDTLSGRPIRRRVYMCVSCLNRSHMVWAWLSLVWVALSDVYVRLCATGNLYDWKILL